MKKHYHAPTIEQTIMSVSLLTTISGEGINHGGTDYGSHEADSRRNDLWDDEE